MVAIFPPNLRFISAEFMYKPRPAGGREQIVFDFALRSRLSQLTAQDAVLFICDSEATIKSLEPIIAAFPALNTASVIANPARYEGNAGDTPQRLEWDRPESWQRCTKTDRWCRIDTALRIGQQIGGGGYLVMPAHDAVWGNGLLEQLAQFSKRYGQKGVPAAVSPYPYWQHSAVPGAESPQEIIDLLNTALNRDVLLPEKIRTDAIQAFWGKMGLLPFALCGMVLQHAEQTVWEDDLELDRVIREQGYGVRALWVNNPSLYRQALPVFDEAGVRTVINRTLHYSLNIPVQPPGASTLNFPLDALGKARAEADPEFARLNARAEAIIADCMRDITARLDRYGASWVDWGAYRYVMRLGDPVVEVWKQN